MTSWVWQSVSPAGTELHFHLPILSHQAPPTYQSSVEDTQSICERLNHFSLFWLQREGQSPSVRLSDRNTDLGGSEAVGEEWKRMSLLSWKIQPRRATVQPFTLMSRYLPQTSPGRELWSLASPGEEGHGYLRLSACEVSIITWFLYTGVESSRLMSFI